jgi:hypothetical protein
MRKTRWFGAAAAGLMLMILAAGPAHSSPPGDGPYAILPAHTEMCLDVQGASSANGARILQYPCHLGNNQDWYYRFVTTAAGSGYKIMPGSGGAVDKCLDVVGGGTHNGADIQQWDCNANTPQQVWQLYTITTSPPSYQLRPLHAPGKCLDVRGVSTAPGAALQLWDCFPSLPGNQVFLIFRT